MFSVLGSGAGYVEVDIGSSDTMTLGMGGKQSEFDRRKKKK